MPNFLQKLIQLAWRLLVLVVGLVIAAVVLAAGLLLTVVLVVWSLVRGRRPSYVRFHVDPRSPFGGMRRETGKPPAEVVDVEAREIPDASGRHPSDRST